ncbi:MAG: DUF2007 domain-containing protein [Thermodesulfobacteriota bacterium]|nr:DUF2007 domain-containing protein [Thermodesulfobacteriota bacterium]
MFYVGSESSSEWREEEDQLYMDAGGRHAGQVRPEPDSEIRGRSSEGKAVIFMGARGNLKTYPALEATWNSGSYNVMDFDIPAISDILIPSMKKLYAPKNEVELSFIKSIFDAEKIPYFVHNDHFGSLKAGLRIKLFNEKTIMVDESAFERASDLLIDLLENVGSTTTAAETEYSLWDRFRMFCEVFLFGWIMPGKSGRSRKPRKRSNNE